jgi:hypothetical protein
MSPGVLAAGSYLGMTLDYRLGPKIPDGSFYERWRLGNSLVGADAGSLARFAGLAAPSRGLSDCDRHGLSPGSPTVTVGTPVTTVRSKQP